MKGTVQLDEQEALERATRAKWESSRPRSSDEFGEWVALTGYSPSEFDSVVDGHVEHARANYQKKRASKELTVVWDGVTPQEVASLQKLLDGNSQEADLHRFLENHPGFLVQVLGGGHGRYQLSKVRLGKELVPDFLVAGMSSIGIEWHAVEIESPRSKVVRKNGEPTQEVNHAIGQIRDWRQWFMNNLDYARRPTEQNGLGLVGIDSRVPGLIIIGRRQQYPSQYNEFRRQMIDRERIMIHSYDWLVDVARSNNGG